MLAKKLPVHTTPSVIKHPSLSHGKTSPKPDVASSRLAVEINGVLNGLVSFVPSEGITAPHLNGKMFHMHTHSQYCSTITARLFKVVMKKYLCTGLALNSKNRI